MIDPYIQIKVTDKQLALLIMTAESQIKWFDDQVVKGGNEYDGEDIEGWDANDGEPGSTLAGVDVGIDR